MLGPALEVGQGELLDEDPVPEDVEAGAAATYAELKRSGAAEQGGQRLIVGAREVLSEGRVARQPRGIPHWASS